MAFDVTLALAACQVEFTPITLQNISGLARPTPPPITVTVRPFYLPVSDRAAPPPLPPVTSLRPSASVLSGGERQTVHVHSGRRAAQRDRRHDHQPGRLHQERLPHRAAQVRPPRGEEADSTPNQQGRVYAGRAGRRVGLADGACI